MGPWVLQSEQKVLKIKTRWILVFEVIYSATKGVFGSIFRVLCFSTGSIDIMTTKEGLVC